WFPLWLFLCVSVPPWLNTLFSGDQRASMRRGGHVERCRTVGTDDELAHDRRDAGADGFYVDDVDPAVAAGQPYFDRRGAVQDAQRQRAVVGRGEAGHLELLGQRAPRPQVGLVHRHLVRGRGDVEGELRDRALVLEPLLGGGVDGGLGGGTDDHPRDHRG